MESIVHVKGKVALVTGAAMGIGEACARVLAAHGARVIVADIAGREAQAVVDGIVRDGGIAESMALDVTREADWRRVIDATLARHGGLDVLVNNAGIAVVHTLLETSLEEWRRVHAVNLDGVFLGTKLAVDVM
ncbi:MAG: SDR family NAD(P)-dependent oxidoreductase, partial [Gammaproteobacteria bacterium]